MALYRFLFAPVLLAVAIAAGGDVDTGAPASPPAARATPGPSPEARPSAAPAPLAVDPQRPARELRPPAARR